MLLALSCGAIAEPPVQFVTTPFGLRPERCVLSIPSGASVAEIPGTDGRTHLRVTHPVHGTFDHMPDRICDEPRYQSNVNTLSESSGPAPVNNKTCDGPPCKSLTIIADQIILTLVTYAALGTCDALPCNNWINNAGFFPPKTIGGFSSIYTVPGTPKGPPGSSILFYFIGTGNKSNWIIVHI